MKDNQTEAKLERIDTKLRNLTFVVILGFVVIALLVIGLYFKHPPKRIMSGAKASEQDESSGVLFFFPETC